MRLRLRLAKSLLVLALTCCEGALAADWHVTIHGKKEGRGTVWAPWDLDSALSGQHRVSPGDTIWIAPGTYRHPDRKLGSPGYVVRLAGSPSGPVRVRGQSGTRVTIDGGITVQPPSNYLWLQDLEILVSENFTKSREVVEPGSHPASYARPWGGLNINTGTRCVYANLVIHDNAQGISFWAGATDSEINGCIIYDNGWKAPDRGHGHAIYTQNRTGIKTIRDCIMSGGYSYTMHAYGSAKTAVDHYLVEGNICYEAGVFLIGGEGPSSDIRVFRNCLFRVPMQIGYGNAPNKDCEVRDNLIVNAGLQIQNFEKVQQEGNLVLHPAAPRPSEPIRVIATPNRYDSRRWHIAVLNWSQQTSAEVACADFLREGDEYRLMDPRRFYGEPVKKGVFHGKSIEVPLQGEFAAFVLLKN